MTYRERQLAKAERLREWADKREERAAAVFEASLPFTSDIAFNTQPGHFPLRARIIAQEDRAHESLAKARDMSSRADGIEAAAERAIYSDDPDALEKLAERIAELEAERERVKAFNAACRRAGQVTAEALELLTPAERSSYASTARSCSTFLGKAGQMPAYVLQNLGGNITRQRQRLEQLTRQRATLSAPVVAEEAGGVDGATVRVRGGRVEVVFPARPAVEVRDELKRAGFRWDRLGSCWVGRNVEVAARIVGVPVPADSGPDATDLAYEDECARRCGL